jgi:RNA polymerase sigma-B factor
VDTLGGNDDGFGLVDARLSFSDAITRLPFHQRRVLSLRLGHDMRQSDIAREIGCSQMQVSRLLRRAAANLRELTDPTLP